MNNAEDLYCRLCAEPKPTNIVLDLQSDDAKKIEIINKLSRLNASLLDLSTSDNLPKTICFVCKDALDKALSFISQIENAQNVLRDIFVEKTIKKEDEPPQESKELNKLEIVLGLAQLKQELEPSVQVKEEQEFEFDGDDPDFEAIICQNKKTRKKRKKKIQTLQDVLDALDDAIPLSIIKCMTWKDYRWLCLYCNLQFLSADELKTHSMMTHNSCMPYKCVDCTLNTKKSFTSFLGHVSKHKKHLKLCCHLCNEKVATKEQLTLHKSEHSVENALECPGCSTRFESYSDLKDHMARYYLRKRGKKLQRNRDGTLSCDICNKSFVNSGNLRKHIQIHTERKRNQTCEKCGKQFYDKGSLTSHMMVHEDLRKHKCEICKAGFRTAAQLRLHVGIHGGVKPYYCDQCGQKFRLHTQLKSHLIIHTDKLPYICEYCNKAFRFSSILKQHVRQHTGVKPYCCEHCLREFTNWPNYNKHMKRRHAQDMAKKKYTPEGVFPINPDTGEIQPLPITSSTEEWKRQVLIPKKRGRPKRNESGDNDVDLKEAKTVECAVLLTTSVV